MVTGSYYFWVPVMKIVSSASRELTAFMQVFKVTKDRLYRLFLKHTKDPYLAEDLLQECYLRAWEKKDTTELHNWENYIFGIAYNMLVGLHRERVREQLMAVEELPQENTDDSTPLTALLFKETRKRAHDALAQLSPQKRRALYLLKEEEMSYKEVSAEMKIPVSTLEKQVAGTLKILRKKLTLFFCWL